ncbi:MAG: biopolymer transporter ExbD, partial [Zetaproteobacteria bacterium]
MRLRGRRRNNDFLVDITPLVDVVFLMLIFFMVSTTFDVAAKLKLELPTAKANAQTDEPKQVVISIDADGRIFVQDEAVEDAAFGKRVLFYTKGDPNVPIVLRADKDAHHGRVVFVLDALSELG